MKMKKVISVVLACACVFSFAACGSKSDSSKSDSAKSDKKEKLVMATNAEFPPFEYYDGDEVVGIDAEFAAAIADKLGMDLKIEEDQQNQNDKRHSHINIRYIENRKINQ